MSYVSGFLFVKSRRAENSITLLRATHSARSHHKIIKHKHCVCLLFVYLFVPFRSIQDPQQTARFMCTIPRANSHRRNNTTPKNKQDARHDMEYVTKPNHQTKLFSEKDGKLLYVRRTRRDKHV